MKRVGFAIAAAALTVIPMTGHASTSTTTIAVSATVQAACSVTATAIAFGNYSSASGNTGTSNVTVTCQATTPYTLDLDAGAHGTLNGQSTTRAMASGASLLNYNLYTTAALTTVFATGAGNDISSTASPSDTQHVYGSLPSGQSSGPGSYTDTVNVTITY